MRTLRYHTCAFARCTRASAGIELGIGAFALVSVAALCFELYTRVEADTALARVAAAMADYVSRGPEADADTLDGKAMKELGAFLHEHVLGVPADLVFVVSALQQPPGNPPPAVKVLWTDNRLRFGANAANLACTSRFVKTGGGGNTWKLPPGIEAVDFAMAAGEEVVVVEACARLTREGAMSGLVIGLAYRHHVLPVRTPGRFPEDAPVYAHRGVPALACPGGAGLPEASA